MKQEESASTTVFALIMTIIVAAFIVWFAFKVVVALDEIAIAIGTISDQLRFR